MKKFVFAFVLMLAALCLIVSLQPKTSAKSAASLVSSSVVISQFQVAGGMATDEFVELHNVSAANVDLIGHRLVYRSSAGTNDVNFVEWTTQTIVPPGGYYLVVSNTYDGATPGNATYNSGSGSMSAGSGGIALRSGAANAGAVIDSVGYGSATNIFVETATTNAPAANSSQTRLANGCQDTDNNSNDFSNSNPAAPRNAGSAPNICGGGTTLSGVGTANPNNVNTGQNVLFIVTVRPTTELASINNVVAGDLSSIGGASSQTFYDDGTNGDQTANDLVFSYSFQVPINAASGAKILPVTITDAEARTANTSIPLTISTPATPDNPLLLGNPSNAVTDVNQPFNYLMVKPQYSLSYNRDNATLNWVAWRLDSSWLGSAQRQDDYRPDPQLPAEWYRVVSSDYSNSGYTRGHMCPSGDRTRSIPDNSATFLMTNFVPQSASNNNGTWNEQEVYLRSLAQSGNEIYTFSGGAGSAGKIGSGCGSANGCVNVPTVTWKVALVLPNGDNDLARISKMTRVIAVIVPNQGTTDLDWRTYRVSVDKVESLTGYNFFSALPKQLQSIIERRIDNQ